MSANRDHEHHVTVHTEAVRQRERESIDVGSSAVHVRWSPESGMRDRDRREVRRGEARRGSESYRSTRGDPFKFPSFAIS